LADLKKPKPYLDTNVILDYMRARGSSHNAVLLLENIKRLKIECITSQYTQLELIDRLQEDKWIERCKDRGLSLDDISRHHRERDLAEPDLKDVFRHIEDGFLRPFVDRGIISMVAPKTDTWDKIYDLLARFNFTIDDAFHVDAAIGQGCDIFVSNDGHLVKLVNDSKAIPAATLDNLDSKLDELGFQRLISLSSSNSP
jgi:predicted nucleic acid-binding protein